MRTKQVLNGSARCPQGNAVIDPDPAVEVARPRHRDARNGGAAHVALGEQRLRRVLRSYVGYYNEARTHRSLKKDAPIPRPVLRIGRIASHALVGGLHHQYVRI